MMLTLGTRVQISEGSGVDSGKVGTIIPPQRERPEGAYKDPGPDEEWVRLGDGRVITMYRDRLTKLPWMPVIKSEVGIDGKQYKVCNGIWYAADTRDDVIGAVDEAFRAQVRVRIALGDRETGRDWCEEFGVTGYVSRTMGPIKAPLLVHNSRSMGGGIISTGALVRIASTRKGGRVFWQHPAYHRTEEE